jgi:hypothetical protein
MEGQGESEAQGVADCSEKHIFQRMFKFVGTVISKMH